jgi:hypothetical protein
MVRCFVHNSPKPFSPAIDEPPSAWKSLLSIARLLCGITRLLLYGVFLDVRFYFRELCFFARRTFAKLVYTEDEWKDAYCEKDGGYPHWYLYLEEPPDWRDEDREHGQQGRQNHRQNVSNRAMKDWHNVIFPKAHWSRCI